MRCSKRLDMQCVRRASRCRRRCCGVVWRRDEIIGEVDFHVIHVHCETSERDEYPLAENIPEFTEHYPGVLYPGRSDSRIPKDSEL